eukprot:TRINITY_DN62964_c0_g1_i1.p1 TRINITY_DN62964_c0_g1~~TRINITY_DN62964_c0_g1_i1.p1  ORF type:complete len:475 (-),score=39.92 TRINITY_DN62964_c0_g1_i1:36-1349(-)
MAPKTLCDIERVVASGLCAGCGLCESMAGQESVKMVLTQEGRCRPRVNRQLDEQMNHRIMKVCPGKQLTGPSAGQAGVRGVMHPVFGPLRTWYRGWAADADVRWRAAAGGSLTALATFLLESGRVQKVLHVRASQADPTTTEALISSSPEEIASGCQSRYGPAPPLVHVCQLLDEGVTFALVAKPCDVGAVRALAKLDPRVDRQIPYMLSIFCGGLPSRKAALQIAAHHGVAERDISLCRFRGHGWPGLMTVGRRQDSREFGTTYNETWRWTFNPLGPDAGIAPYDLQWRCKVCPDAIGELADVSCPDGWLFNEEKGRYVSEEGPNPGQNLILARTAAGEDLVAECTKAGKLVLAPLEISELEAMHADHYPRKCSWPVRLFAAWLFGGSAVTLSVSNYRPMAAVWSALRTVGVGGLLRVLTGTVQRLRTGAHKEPLA